MDQVGATLSRTGRRERRDAVENRARILSAARQLFESQGVDKTTMQEVAQLANVGPGTLYRRFAHKGELCAAILADDFAAFQREFSARAEHWREHEPALPRLNELIDPLVQQIERHIPLLAAMQQASPSTGLSTIYWSPYYTWLHAYISRILEAAVEQGEIAPLDVPFVADAILGAIAPPLFAFQRQERGFSLERIVAGVRRVFIQGELMRRQ